tara:strand:- start:3619 stop:4821 length:1203 start_codon:yes stop_codon:yes gene_type:complete
MKKTERKYIVALILITLLVAVIKIIQPKPLDWSESYSATDKIPFGAFILKDLIPKAFRGQEILTNNIPIFENELGDTHKSWIFINSNFALDEFETEILNENVTLGDIVFISARQLGGAFADSLNLEITGSFPAIDPQAKSLDSLISNSVNFTNKHIRKLGGWSFPRTLTESYFSSFDTSRTTILGYNAKDQVNFIKVDSGDGFYLIHSNPFLFTNYYLRDVERFDYAFKALSYLPSQPVLWDEYYKAGRLSFSSPLQFVVSNSNLKWAWFIGLFGMIAYLIFNGRRSQRIIPVINPPINSSIDFAQTIGNLYLNNGTHKEILEKKILFLFEYIRANLNIRATDFDESILKDIANRSGIDQEEINQLFMLIELLRSKQEITDTELKRITERIDRFYKQSQR